MMVVSVKIHDFRGQVIDCLKQIGEKGENWAEGLADESE